MKLVTLLSKHSVVFLEINFVHRSRWFSVYGLLLMLAGGAVLFAASSEYFAAADFAQRQGDRVVRLERQLGKLSRSTQATLVKMDPTEWRSLQALTDELNYPLTQQFVAVERSLNDDVAILALQPEPKAGRLKILGEAKSLDGAIGFAERIKAAAGFQSADVTHHEYRMVGTERVLGFSILAQ
jgi:hypothetical protein